MAFGCRHVALSNTNGFRFQWNDKLAIWTFDATRPISTYLFAIVIGEFSSNCGFDPLLGDDICIWRFSNAEFWNETAELIIEDMSRFQSEMTDYLLIDPGMRLHIVIIPLQLNGMENAGLLYISENVSDCKGHNCTFCLAVAHGRQTVADSLWKDPFPRNDAPMDWWDDIWLSESLTSYLSAPRPFKHTLVNDITEDPIVSLKWATDIPRLVYTKGAVLISMLEDVIGPNRMRRLLRNYVRINQYKTANTTTFLTLLDEISQVRGTFSRVTSFLRTFPSTRRRSSKDGSSLGAIHSYLSILTLK
ncbi:hypothetical protein L596_002630 [Steinernema carpocapsae]|uniref:Peptidase M1 membrane alanine aminopeptidase domain-containing protein n=1 Tax=Steinernema carpocapsae TaxID=34508 RepID=A0A4U8UQ64_STECR|nr:hypothetical protein L596_002630 [Steinernema carpocapsae]